MTPAEWREALRDLDRSRDGSHFDRARMLRRAHLSVARRLSRAWVVAGVAAVMLLAAGAALPVADVEDEAADDSGGGVDDANGDDEQESDEDGSEDDPPDDGDDEVQLDVQLRGDGSGTVTSQGGEIDCGERCTASLPVDEEVVLEAAAEDERSTFVDWGHADCPDPLPDCRLTLGEDTRLEPRFEPVILLTVATQRAPGVILIDPVGAECRFECEYWLARGTGVTLRAEEQDLSAFLGWEGSDCGEAVECSFEMTDNIAVSALFHEPVQLTVTIDCCGSVQIDPGQVVCDASCKERHRLGTDLTLTPQPAEGYDFEGWQDACTERPTPNQLRPPCQLTMDQERSVTAMFEKIVD